MSYTVTEETFSSLSSYWSEARYDLNWPSIFVLPPWLRVWWQVFGSGAELYLRAVWRQSKIIGIAPLLVKERTAAIIGSPDVCDYLDFIITPGMENEFFTILFDGLSRQGIIQLDLKSLRPDSTVLTHLVTLAQDRGYDVICHNEDVSVEMDLPLSWDDYLAMLDKKQRHEIRRKLRRLWAAGKINHHCLVRRDAGDFMETFLMLFSLSRKEKAGFMTYRMTLFFRLITEAMAEVGLLRLGVLELEKWPVAMVIGFDYHDVMYLYNSAYNPEYDYLSVGLLSKALCLKESIEGGKKRWDFLKGGEQYKYRMGGMEIPLKCCQIILK
ncbi:GNAT family N-acetyltransferase [Chloroflexota bacterium]